MSEDIYLYCNITFVFSRFLLCPMHHNNCLSVFRQSCMAFLLALAPSPHPHSHPLTVPLPSPTLTHTHPHTQFLSLSSHCTHLHSLPRVLYALRQHYVFVKATSSHITPLTLSGPTTSHDTSLLWKCIYSGVDSRK